MKVFIFLLLVAGAVESITVLDRSDCDKTPETGLCRGYFPRYYYDQETGQCKEFIYGGCGGNGNNFKTEDECYNKCGDEVCGENERYSVCGTACPLTCENYDDPPEICPAVCRIGCECEKGFIRSQDGRCIRPEHCPNRQEEVCGENERFSTCGTACPLTCENYDDPPEICPAVCRIGCECQKGFIRSQDGRCIRPEQCPNRQETQSDCSGPPLTGPCRVLATRYYYDPSTDKCSPFVYGGCHGNGNNFQTEEECNQKCRAKCGKNEHFVDCRRRCPLTCGNYENPPACVEVCEAGGCQCKEGFVRTNNGSCVKPENCPVKRNPTKCGKNEHFVDCGTPCPLTCDNYENPPEICPAMCVVGCQCKEGFVRTERGSCVKPEKCPVKRNNTRPDCPPNKEYGSFGDCPDSCYSLDHPVRACTRRLNYGCKCKDGYVLKEDKVFESECIKPEECPKDACNE